MTGAPLDVLQAFERIDALAAEGAPPGPLHALRERLAAELEGAPERAVAVVSEDFTVTTHLGGGSSTMGREQLAASVEQLRALSGSLLLWIEIDRLLVVPDALALHGRMRTLMRAALATTRLGRDDLGTDDACCVSVPLALFTSCDGTRMTDETVFVQDAATVVDVLRDVTWPELDRIRAAVR